MNSRGRRSWLPAALLAGVLYFLAGTIFGFIAGAAATLQGVKLWRFAAFFLCGVFFAVHVLCERLLLRSDTLETAWHVALGAAVGGFLLAVGANAHAWQAHSGNLGKLAFALVAWPVVTAVPAFVLAWIAAAVLRGRRTQRSV